MNEYRMYWGEPVVPCVRTTRRQKYVDPAYKRYERWKGVFRLAANIQGFPEELELGKAYSLDVAIWVMGKARYDLDNAIKGCLDALFKQDRRVLAIQGRIHEKSSKESAMLTLAEIA